MAEKSLPSPEWLRQHFDYDPETGKLFWKPRPLSSFKNERLAKAWSSRCVGKEAFPNADANGYKSGRCQGVSLYAHRIAWAMMVGEWPAEQVDHINGDRSDNRWTNLRAVSLAENRKNQRLSAKNTSGHAGVGWMASRGKWRAQIKVRGQVSHLGVFDDIQEAIAARLEAERQHGFHENHGKPLTATLDPLDVRKAEVA